MTIQLLINGFSMGSIYSLIALGLVLIIKAVNVRNFAQGEIVMVGAFVFATALLKWKMPMLVAILFAMIVMMLFGYLFQRVAYYPLRFKPATTVIVCTIGISMFLKNIALAIWGSQPLRIPGILGNNTIKVFSVYILPQYLLIILFTILIVIMQNWFFKKTTLGKQMEATAQDKEAAALMGVSVTRMIAYTFIFSTLLATVAGILMSPIYFVYPGMGSVVGLKAFCAIMIGGFGSIPGALIGGLLVGLTETFAAAYISSVYKDTFAFILLLLVLMVRPRGLFGEKISEKV